MKQSSNNVAPSEALNHTSEILISTISKDLCTAKTTQDKRHQATHYKRFEVRWVHIDYASSESIKLV